jgi:phosphomannomutase
MEHVFRAYDIRGVYKKDITEEFAYKIGLSFANVLRGDGEVIVGRDARIGGFELQAALTKGLLEGGVSVTDIGMVPIPVLNFACLQSDAVAGVIISASHNPPEYNGIRFRQEDGTGFVSCIPKVKELYFSGAYKKAEKLGEFKERSSDSVVDEYVNYLTEKLCFSTGLKIAIDPGNGAASGVAKKLLKAAGCDVVAINDVADGNFPGRGPYPNKKTLGGLQKFVIDETTSFGAAYDGDADRLVVVDNSGKVLSAEEMGLLFLRSILPHSASKKVAANIDCSMTIREEVEALGGELEEIRVGDVFLAEAVKRGAVFAMESSNHFVIPSLFPFDDGISASLYFAKIVSELEKALHTVVECMPNYPSIRKTIDCPDDKKFEVVREMGEKFKEYELIDIDGVKVNFEEGWFLLRASNTQPLLRFTVEARTEEKVKEYTDKAEAVLEKLL